MSSMQLTSTKIDLCLQRYRQFYENQLLRTRWCGDPAMSTDYELRDRWIDARRNYLKDEYEAAVLRERKLPPR